MKNLLGLLKGYDNLKLRNKFLVVFIVPMFALMFFVLTKVHRDIKVINETSKINDELLVPMSVSNLIHELQKERGYYSGFIETRGEIFKKSLQFQIKQTDKRINQIKNIFNNEYIKLQPNLKKHAKEAKKLLNQIEIIRSENNSFEHAFLKSYKYYSKINAEMISIVDASVLVQKDLILSHAIATYSDFIQLKELVGRERAIITGILAKGEFTLKSYYIWHEQYIKQELYRNSFVKNAEFSLPGISEFYKVKASQSSSFSEIRKIQSVLITKPSVKDIAITPQELFSIYTQKVEVLKEIEKKIEIGIKQRLNDLKVAAFSGLLISVSLLLVIIISILLFCYLFSRSILNPLLKISNAAGFIGNGDLSTRIEVKSSDEIGELGHSLNSMASRLKTYQTEREEIIARAYNSERLASLGGLSAAIAHEINNCLSVIVLTTKMLEKINDRGDKNDMVKEAILDISSTTERIMKITAGLKATSRESLDDCEPVMLKDVFTDVIALCDSKIKSISAELFIVLDSEEFKSEILAERVQLSQVFINLFGNACDAIKDREEKWIKTEVENNCNECIIRITDSGSGIDLSIQDKIFAPFFTSKGIGEGTGLGLSISKKIITRFNGSIDIDKSSLNTCFVIKIPLIKANQGKVA